MHDLSLIPVFVVFGFVFSLPVFMISLIFFNLLIHRFSSNLLIKTILCIVSIIGVFITFAIIKGSMAFTMSLIYSGSVIISSTLFKIHGYKKIFPN